MRTLFALTVASLMLAACDEGPPNDKPVARAPSLCVVHPNSSSATTSPDVGDDHDDDGTEPEENPTSTDAVAEESPYGPFYEFILAPTIEDGVLSFLVQYGGGCVEHSFDVVSYRSDEQPDVLELDLIHDNGGDPCLALPIAMHTVDLTDLLGEACTVQVELNTPSETWIIALPVDPSCEG